MPVISYLTEDALGSVRVTTNSFGEVKARRDFLPFGEELYAGLAGRNANQKYSASADDTRKKFATYQRDIETGLDFAQSRYYSPMHGRFTSPDEFKGGPDELFDFEEDASDNPTFYADLTNPQSLNKYQYGYNNPYKYNDPTGHCPPLIIGGIAVACFILSNPTPIGPRKPQTRAEQAADVLGILPIPGSKYVGGLVGKVLFKGGAKTASSSAVKQVVGGAVEKATSRPKFLKPDTTAKGPHTGFRRDKNGRVTRYTTYEKNPKNPTGNFTPRKSVDVQPGGRPHRNSITRKPIPTPHTQSNARRPNGKPRIPGGVRPARRYELPKNQ